MLDSHLAFPIAHPPLSVADRASLLQRLGDALSAYGEVEWAYVHGSFAEGLPYHDIDVAAWLRPDVMDQVDLIAFEADIGRTLRHLAGAEVDVHVINRAPLGFQHAVLQGDPIMVRDDQALVVFIEYVGREMMDFAYLREAYLKDLLRS